MSCCGPVVAIIVILFLMLTIYSSYCQGMENFPVESHLIERSKDYVLNAPILRTYKVGEYQGDVKLPSPMVDVVSDKTRFIQTSEIATNNRWFFDLNQTQKPFYVDEHDRYF